MNGQQITNGAAGVAATDFATVSQVSGAAFGAVLFDSTLVGDTASIDTGGGGIAGGYKVIEAWMILRTDDAAAVAAVNLNLNNDSGANYDKTTVINTNATVTGATVVGQTAITANVHGSGGTASYASIVRFTIPAYAATTFFKVGELDEGVTDSTAANNRAAKRFFGYRSTAAITRFAVAAQGAAKLKAGSRLTIIGW